MRPRVTTHRLSPPQYLESPAGSGSPFEAGKGSSSCLKGGKQVGCKWDDVSRAWTYFDQPSFSSDKLSAELSAFGLPGGLGE